MLKKKVVLIDSLILKSVFNDIMKKFQFKVNDNHQFIINITKIMRTDLTLTAINWMSIFKSKWFAQDLTQARKRVDHIDQMKEITLILFINFKCNVESQIIKRQRRRLNLNKNMLNINNFDVINLNKDIDENFIFELRSKEVESILKEIDDANVYVIV